MEPLARAVRTGPRLKLSNSVGAVYDRPRFQRATPLLHQERNCQTDVHSR
jgi:hypothetical protein